MMHGQKNIKSFGPRSITISPYEIKLI